MEVKRGTSTTLQCRLTDLDAAVTISWYDGDTPISTVQDGEYSDRKLEGGDDEFKSMILRDERLIGSRWWVLR